MPIPILYCCNSILFFIIPLIFIHFKLQEDCIPEDLKAPGTRDEAGIDHVDVMNFLDLKRAKPIHAEQEKKP